MADAVPGDVLGQLKDLCRRLDRRGQKARLMGRYREGSSPVPDAIRRARVTKAYRDLMPMAEAPWGSLVIGSIQDRLEVSGIRTGSEALDRKLWDWWQGNQMDSESDLAHDSALTDGRANAMVWPDGRGRARITLDDSATTVVQHRAGSRFDRTAALRRWREEGDERTFATLYTPDLLYKFETLPMDTRSGDPGGWTRREVPGEDWPAPNPFGVVPVVELRVGGRLRPGGFPHARGDFEHCTGLIDRINLLTFLGLVVAFYMGFPLRGLIGNKILREVLRDDNGDPIIDESTNKPKEVAVPPFDPNVGGFFQIENPEGRIAEYQAADRKNLSVFAELDQLATITDTPRHYFPMEHGMSNLSADAIRASEGALHAKARGHKKSLGPSWLAVFQLGGQMSSPALGVPDAAEVRWMNHESRSLSEMADAAGKLKDVLPFAALAELCLNATQEQIRQWTSDRASDALHALVEAAKQPAAPAPAPVPAGAAGGNGAG